MKLKSIGLLIAALSFVACTAKKAAEEPSTEPGAGGGGAPTNPVSSITLSYANVVDMTQYSNITPLVPTSSNINGLSNFKVTPELPSGLVIDSSTGEISGPPYGRWDPQTYTVSATAVDGTASTTITFGIYALGETSIDPSDTSFRNFRYSQSHMTFFVGVPITSSGMPVYTGDTPTGYTNSGMYYPPQMESYGLSFNATTGAISGTPTTPLAETEFNISVSVTGGSVGAKIFIKILSGPPTALTYSTPTASYPVGTAITANTPSNAGGNVDSYAISPALPAGLSFNTTTGVISGTPSIIAAAAAYTVTATNAAGSTTSVVNITVPNAAPGSLNYSRNTARYTVGAPIAANSPSIGSGGSATSYSVSPTLPAGLALDTTTGVITGTPTMATSSATYTVTATNAVGSTTKGLTIVVVVPGSHTIYSADGGTIKAYSVDETTGEPIYVGKSISSGVVSKFVFHPTMDCAFGYSGGSLFAYSIDKANAGALTAINSAGGLGGPVNLEILASGKYIYVHNDTSPSTQFIARYSVDQSTCAVSSLGTTSTWTSTTVFGRDLAVAGNNVYVIDTSATIKHYTVNPSTGDLTLSQTIAMSPHANPPSATPAVGTGRNLRGHPNGNYIYAFDSLKAIQAFSVDGSTGDLTSIGTGVSGGTIFQGAPVFDAVNNFMLTTYTSASSAGVGTINIGNNGSAGVGATIEGNSIVPYYNAPQSVAVFTSQSGTYIYTTFSYAGRSGAIRLSMDTSSGWLTSLGADTGLWGVLSGY